MANEVLRSYRCAAIQFKPHHAQKEANVARLIDLVRRAAAGGVRLIVTPEMGTLGCIWRDRAEIGPFVEPIPGPTTERFCHLASELNIYVSVGLAEVDQQTGAYYNSAILVGPEGLIGRHRKVHAYVCDPLWASDGDLGFQVWETELGKLGILTCMDINYPESARLLNLQGADVLLLPANWIEEACPAPLWVQRAYENHVTLICANRWGTEYGLQFSGGSCVIDPGGTIQAYCTSGDQVVFGEIDFDDRQWSHPDPDHPQVIPVEGRRPELYGDLALNRYLWSQQEISASFGRPSLPAGTRFTATVWDFEASPRPVTSRLKQLDTWMNTYGDPRPRLVVLPELSFIGPGPSREIAETVSEPIPGPTVAALESWCACHGAHLVAGLIERQNNAVFNTIVLVGPEGLCTRYRKTHLGRGDHLWATPGDRFAWFDTPLGCIGLLSGTDLLYPEPLRCLALNGVDIACVPAALVGPKPMFHPETTPTDDCPLHWHLPRTRSSENNIYLAVANWSGECRGEHCMGYGGIFFGPVLCQTPGSEILASRGPGQGDCAAAMIIDTRTAWSTKSDNPVRTKPDLTRRLPAWYAPLIASK